jgi:hypothetical protein
MAFLPPTEITAKLNPVQELDNVFRVVEILSDLCVSDLKLILRTLDGGFVGIILGAETSRRSINLEKIVTQLPRHLLAYIVKEDRGSPQKWHAYISKGMQLLHNLMSLSGHNARLGAAQHGMEWSTVVLDLVLLASVVWMQNLAGHSSQQSSHPSSGATVAQCVEGLRLCASVLAAALQADVDRGQYECYDSLLTHARLVVFICTPIDALQLLMRLLNNPMCKDTSASGLAASVSKTIVAILYSLYYMCLSEEFVIHLVQHEQFFSGEFLDSIIRLLKTNTAEHEQIMHQTLRTLYVLFEKENPCFLDIVASNPLSLKQAQTVIQMIISMASGVVDKSTCTSSALEAFKLVELLSDDSNFKNEIIAGATTLILRLLSLPPDVVTSVFMTPPSTSTSISSTTTPSKCSSSTSTSSSSAPSNSPSTSTTSGDAANSGSSQSGGTNPDLPVQDVMVLLFRIVGNLHCFNEAVCKPEDKGRFLRTVVDTLSRYPLPSPSRGHGPKADIHNSNILKNLHFLLFHLSKENHIYNLNMEELELFTSFSEELQKTLGVKESDSDVASPMDLSTNGNNTVNGTQSHTHLHHSSPSNPKEKDKAPSPNSAQVLAKRKRPASDIVQ